MLGWCSVSSLSVLYPIKPSYGHLWRNFVVEREIGRLKETRGQDTGRGVSVELKEPYERKLGDRWVLWPD
jgi:hypothetical protein